MKRLKHNVKAYLLAIRMTRSDTIIFVEGAENDPFFYETIANRYQDEMGRKTEIRTATELPNAAKANRGGSGGKRTLLRASAFTRRWRTTLAHNKLGDKQIVFCVDKDIDDIQGIMEQRPDLIYTRLHSVENHLVMGADFHKAIAIALSVTEQSVRLELPTHDRVLDLARQWRDWVALCILGLCLPNSTMQGYGQSSQINKPAHLPTDPKLAADRVELLRANAKCDAYTFDIEQRKALEIVDKRLKDNRFDEIFKGRWYADILFSLCSSCQRLETKCRSVGKNALWIGIRASFVLPERDYQYYKTHFQKSGGEKAMSVITL